MAISTSSLSGELVDSTGDLTLLSIAGNVYTFELATYNEDFFAELYRGLGDVAASAPDSWLVIYGINEWTIRGGAITGITPIPANPLDPYRWKLRFGVINTGIPDPPSAITYYGVITRVFTNFAAELPVAPAGPWWANGAQFQFFVPAAGGADIANLQAQIDALVASEKYVVSGTLLNQNTTNAILRLTLNDGSTIDINVGSLEDTVTNAQIIAALATLPTGANTALAVTPSSIRFLGSDNQWHTLSLPTPVVLNSCAGAPLATGSAVSQPATVRATGIVTNQTPGGCAAFTDTLYDSVALSTAHNSSLGNVASGLRSQVGGGTGNTASGINAFIGAGNGNLASGTASVISGGANSTASSANATVSGGASNTASGASSTVIGGTTNASSNTYAISGGALNTASGFATIALGYSNQATVNYATVSGGSTNAATSGYATIAGGSNNTANANHAVIGGGSGNTASGSNSTIGGGANCRILTSSIYSTIGGGAGNAINLLGGGNNAAYSVVAGGNNNIIDRGYMDIIGGGNSNRINSTLYYNGIFCGASNSITGVNYFSTIGGGGANAILKSSGHSDVITGGYNNRIDATISTGSYYSVIGGGGNNLITGNVAQGNAITGGVSNQIDATTGPAVNGNTVSGGSGNIIRHTTAAHATGNNTIAGGISNEIRGSYATILGGYTNRVGTLGNQNAQMHSTVVGGYGNNVYIEAAATNGQYSLGDVVLGYANTVTGGNNSFCNIAVGSNNTVRGARRQAIGNSITASNAAGTAQDNSLYLAGAAQKLSFYNVPAVARQTLPATPTMAALAAALRNLGLIA